MLKKISRKRAVRLSCIACIAVLAGFGGFMGVKYFQGAQDPVVLETVSDEVKAPEKSDANLNLAVKSACLIDADTGMVVYQQDSHKELPPASVTKIMTMLLAMEAVDAGKIKLNDEVTISENAASMGGSQMYMEVGEVHTLEELMQGMAIASANDAAIAVAEYVAAKKFLWRR